MRVAASGRLGFRFALVIESGRGFGGVFSIRKRTSSRLLRERVMANPSGKSGASVSRRLPSGDRKRGLKKHTRLVGEVVWAWSELQKAYAFAFSQTVDNEGTMIGHAIWTALNNDSAQRDILDEALYYSLKVKAAQRKRIQWAIKETGHLKRYRNDIVHGARGWEITTRGLIPTFSSYGNPINRLVRYADRESDDGEWLAGPDIHQLMVLLRGDLMQLAAYVKEIGRAIAGRKPSALPRKPRLLARKFALAAETKAKSPKRRQGRGSPPKPSRT